MSAATTSDPVKDTGASTKSKRKNKKKKGGGNATKAEETPSTNGTPAVEDGDGVEEVEEQNAPAQNHTSTDHTDDVEDVEDEDPPEHHIAHPNGDTKNKPHSISTSVALGLARSRSQQGLASPSTSPDPSSRLDALAKERDTLRQEVTELRKSLETIQGKHEEEINSLREELEETSSGKEHFETQYKNLLGRVNTIRTSLGERLKEDTAKLETARQDIESLEETNRALQETNESLTEQISTLKQESESQASEIATLRNRTTLSQQNWVKERDELIQREAYAREEFDNAKQAMQDWEVLAMDERSLRESLGDRVTELEEQLNAQREALERASGERDVNEQAVEGLQRALREVQDARKIERRELVEQAQTQLEDLRRQLQSAEESATTSATTLATVQKELERALPFEKEVKEKNLLIGKLRHEAVILNDHLTKALRILKKGRPEDNVDRQIVSNYFIHFLEIDRSDPKKFEALQLIAALLNWNDEQREKAGLLRSGSTATNSSLRIPLSPFRRTPSTPSLNSSAAELMASSNSNKESLAELWSNFLEQEAKEGGSEGSRRESVTSPGSGKGEGLGISEK